MRVCELDSCERKHKAKGVCNTHYRRIEKGMDLTTPVVRRSQHGKSYSREYRTWNHMVQRCNNSNEDNYKNYGGRGITVCERWVQSFDNFYADMGDRPQGTSLDRIDVNKGYYTENCRWASRALQNINQRPQKNKSGYRGIYANGLKWTARFRGKYLGNFNTKIEASEAYVYARLDYLKRELNV